MYENYSVLFVDDEMHILNSLRRGLMDEEYHHFFANSGQEALEIMEKREIHLIVSDMRMPQMTGLELLKLVSEKWPRTVKVILSGYTQLPQILTTINQVDIFKFVTKPWTLSELDAIIKKSLDYYIMQEENINYQKVLENKNVAYQNILKRIEVVIAEARKSSEILGLCGKTIFGFEKKYSLKERIKFQNIFSLEEEIFEMISKAVVNEKKEYNIKEIGESSIELIKLIFPEAECDLLPELQKSFNININLFQTAISIILKIFKEEFENNGIIVKLKYEENFKLSLIAPKLQSIMHLETMELTSLDIKKEFAQCIVSELLRETSMFFQILIVEGNLLIGFSVDEKQAETI